MKDRNMPAQGNKTGRAPLTYDLISKYRGALMGLAIISILIFHFTDDCRIYQTKFEGIIYYYNMLIASPYLICGSFIGSAMSKFCCPISRWRFRLCFGGIYCLSRTAFAIIWRIFCL